MTEKSPVDQTPTVFLDGEPQPRIDEQERPQHIPEDQTTYKMLRGNRYEHFESTGHTVVVDDHELRVLGWTGSTYVAE